MESVKRYYRLLNIELLWLSVLLPQMMWAFLTFGLYYEDAVYADLPNQICVGTGILFFFSFARHTIIFHDALRAAYFERKPSSLCGNFCFLFKQKFFWIKVAVFAAGLQNDPRLAQAAQLYQAVEKNLRSKGNRSFGIFCAVSLHSSSKRWREFSCHCKGEAVFLQTDQRNKATCADCAAQKRKTFLRPPHTLSGCYTFAVGKTISLCV